jgi:predicted DCC family thiol-disulfide oxidoreductase YuxK
MRLLTWLDWFHKVDLRPINDLDAAAIAPQEAIHCITPTGEIHRGARALRFLGMRMPALLPMGLFLWFPGVIFFAEKVYMWISRNRLLLSKWFGCKEACALMPERKRD